MLDTWKLCCSDAVIRCTRWNIPWVQNLAINAHSSGDTGRVFRGRFGYGNFCVHVLGACSDCTLEGSDVRV